MVEDTTVTEEVNEQEQDDDVVSFEEKYQALEQQCYLMYVQLHSLTKILVDANVVSQSKLSEEMEELNRELIKLTAEIIEEEKKLRSKE